MMILLIALLVTLWTLAALLWLADGHDATRCGVNIALASDRGLDDAGSMRGDAGSTLSDATSDELLAA